MFRPSAVNMKPKRWDGHERRRRSRAPAGTWRYATSSPSVEAHEFWSFLFSLAPRARIINSETR